VSFRGKRARADFPTKAAAEAWQADALAALMNGRPLPASQRRAEEAPKEGTGITLQTALRWTEEGRWAGAKSSAKLAQNGGAVARYLGFDRSLEGITTADLLRMQRDFVKAGDGPATVNRKLSALGAIFKEAEVRTSYAFKPPRFPARLAEPPGREAVLTADQVEQVVAWMRRLGDTETADLIATLFWSGIRLGEAEKLRLSDVKKDGARLVFDVKGTKNGDDRKVPVVAQLRPVIDRRLTDLNGQPRIGRLFPTLRPFAALRLFQRACTVLEIEGEDLCLHTLRHSCGTRLARVLPPRVVMEWMGHKSPAMMIRYSHVLADDVRKAADTLDSEGAAA
jgi:integrase